MNCRRCTLYTALYFIVHISLAQSGNEISVPATPAFSILNFEPASIMRPSNPKELSADILNSFDENGKLLLNIGIEVAPYWLKSRSQLTREQYLGAKGKQSILQTLMLSVATVKDSVTNNNRLGTGFRFKFAGGEVSAEYRAKERELVSRATLMAAVASAKVFIQMKDPALKLSTKSEVIEFIEGVLQDSIAQINPDYLAEFRAYAKQDSAAFENTTDGLLRFVEAINNRIDIASEDLKKEVVALSKKRIGFIAEVAGASSFRTGNNDSFEKAGLWFNASNVISPTDAWSFSARYFFTGSDSSMNSFDLGTAYIKELTNFSLSFEALARFYRAEMPDFNLSNEPITRVDKDFTYRLAAQAAYKISEHISINISLGKDFDAPFINRSGFFSIFGINYNIFKNAKAAMPPPG